MGSIAPSESQALSGSSAASRGAMHLRSWIAHWGAVAKARHEIRELSTGGGRAPKFTESYVVDVSADRCLAKTGRTLRGHVSSYRCTSSTKLCTATPGDHSHGLPASAVLPAALDRDSRTRLVSAVRPATGPGALDLFVDAPHTAIPAARAIRGGRGGARPGDR